MIQQNNFYPGILKKNLHVIINVHVLQLFTFTCVHTSVHVHVFEFSSCCKCYFTVIHIKFLLLKGNYK